MPFGYIRKGWFENYQRVRRNVLRNVVCDEISSVDRAANPYAKVVLTKRYKHPGYGTFRPNPPYGGASKRATTPSYYTPVERTDTVMEKSFDQQFQSSAEKADAIIKMSKHGEVTADQINAAFEKLSKREFGNHADWLARGAATPWGQQMLNASAAAHRLDVQKRNACGDGDKHIALMNGQAAHEEGTNRHDTDPDKTRRFTAGHELNVDVEESENSTHEGSYDPYKARKAAAIMQGVVERYAKKYDIDVSAAYDAVLGTVEGRLMMQEAKAV